LGATPFDQLAAHEVQQAVQQALQDIPQVFRGAVILRDLEGLSYEEIAEVLECSVGTVKSRILRGRRALKDLLEPLLGKRETSARAQASHEHRGNRHVGAASDSGSNPGARPSAGPGIMQQAAHGELP
jgi:hypothetical protein